MRLPSRLTNRRAPLGICLSGMSRLAVGPLLLVASALIAPAAQARSPAGISAVVTRNGVQVALLLPRAEYPWQALARVTVRVRNLSPQSVLVDSGSYCPHSTPFVAVWKRGPHVLAPSGITAVPPRIPCIPPTGGGGPPRILIADLPGVHLAPGAQHDWQFIVVLGGPRLRAGVSASTYAGNQFTGSYRLFTPFAYVRFGREAPPLVHFCPPPAVCAHISPAPGTRPAGPLYLASSAAIVTPGLGTTTCRAELTPRPVAGRTIAPNCSRATTWRFMAGWLNHRVVEREWKKQPGQGV